MAGQEKWPEGTSWPEQLRSPAAAAAARAWPAAPGQVLNSSSAGLFAECRGVRLRPCWAAAQRILGDPKLPAAKADNTDAADTPPLLQCSLLSRAQPTPS